MMCGRTTGPLALLFRREKGEPELVLGGGGFICPSSA